MYTIAKALPVLPLFNYFKKHTNPTARVAQSFRPTKENFRKWKTYKG